MAVAKGYMNYRQVDVHFFSSLLWHAKHSSSSSTLIEVMCVLEPFCHVDFICFLAYFKNCVFILFASIGFTGNVLCFTLFFFLQKFDTDVAILIRDKNKAVKRVQEKVTHHPLCEICILGRFLS